MTNYLWMLFYLGIGYFAGCFQSAYIIGKWNKHIDIRQYGSGNSGTTNALRVMGVKMGLLTFLGDFLKAFLTVFFIYAYTKQLDYAVVTGLGVVLGHDFPIFLGFRGGKGIASTIGIAFAIDYRFGLLCVLVMATVVFISKYVSVGSILLCCFFGLYFTVFIEGHSILAWLIMTGIGLLGIVQHRDNVKRLFSGTENKLSFKKR